MLSDLAETQLVLAISLAQLLLHAGNDAVLGVIGQVDEVGAVARDPDDEIRVLLGMGLAARSSSLLTTLNWMCGIVPFACHSPRYAAKSSFFSPPRKLAMKH